MEIKTINYYINRTLDYYESKKKHIGLFLAHSDYMVPGRYAFSRNMKYIYSRNTDNEMIRKIIDHSNNKDSIKKILLNFLILIILRILYPNLLYIKRIPDIEVKYMGVIYVLNTNDTGFKIFCILNNVIIEFFHSDKEYNRKLHNYQSFYKYFPMPEVISFDSGRLNITTRLIDVKGINLWSKNDFNKIMQDVFYRYTEYFKSCKKKDMYHMDAAVKSPYSTFGNATRSRFIQKYIPDELLKKAFPYIKLHGDLHAGNILIDSMDKILYIDWELSDNYIFFFDIFYLIKCTADDKNPVYLDSYMSGEYDLFLTQLFKLFGMKYEKKYRAEYLSIFMVNCYDAKLKILKFKSKANKLVKYSFLDQLKRDMRFLDAVRHKYN